MHEAEGCVISLLMSGRLAEAFSGEEKRKEIQCIDQLITQLGFIGNNTWAEWSIDRRCAVIVSWDKYLQAFADSF